MAKAKRKARQGIPAGSKQCPNCGKIVKGARTKVCEHCNKPFPAKEAAKSTGARSTGAVPATLGLIVEIREWVDESGGFDAVLAQLDRIDEVAGKCGGLGELRSTVEAIRQIVE